MNEAHDPEHELWLAELLAGERARDAAEVQQRLASCATCRLRLSELTEVAEQLAESDADRRRDLAAAAATGPAHGEERLLATLERLASPGPRRLRVWPWLLAAAVLAVLGLWWRARTPVEPAAPAVILGDVPALVAPRAASDYGRFEWRYHERPTGGYRVSIYDAAAPAEAPPVLMVPCTTTSWVPDEAMRRGLPARIRWKVEALDDFGVYASSESVSAWRSP